MPTIFDNLEHHLFKELKASREESTHAEFCVGYLNLREWKHLAGAVAIRPGGKPGRPDALLAAPEDN